MKSIIGAHVSTAGGLYNCFDNGERIGAEAVQIFGASPRQWRASLPNDEVLKAFHDRRKESPIKKVFLHASYLVNLGTPNKELYAKSLENLTTHLRIANLLEAEGLIYHIGSYKDSTPAESYKRIAEGMNTVIKNAPGPADLIMENSAGGGNKIGITIEEIGNIFQQAKNPRIKVCIDTCHAHAAGMSETFSPKDLKKIAKECGSAFGLANLTVLHINDSMTPFNSRRDRHENIGEGTIGLQGFADLAQAAPFNNIPWLLEVPGFEKTGPDKKNLDLIKKLFANRDHRAV